MAVQHVVAAEAAVVAELSERKHVTMNTNKLCQTTRALCLATLLAASGACASTSKSSTTASFETPDQAMRALADVVTAPDTQGAENLFGEGAVELLSSGDEVADRADAEQVQRAIREKLAFEERGANTKVALIGVEAWPFPIPLVAKNGRWQFDVEAGLEEIECRRIGRNELSTLATLHEFVDAQREYAETGHDGREPQFARRVLSTAGQHDGLYWPVAEGEMESPLGPLIAAAVEEGYGGQKTEGASAFHGYHFRMLTSQGQHAPGGEKNYVDDKGAMTRGFALLAWPAKYGNSGVMTLLVGPQGIVYEKDLGEGTDAAVAQIRSFDPDESWNPTGD